MLNLLQTCQATVVEGKNDSLSHYLLISLIFSIVNDIR